MSAEQILVTGAAGTLGGEVVSMLMDCGFAVNALVHRQHDLFRNDKTPIATSEWQTRAKRSAGLVVGDISAPRLGMSAAGWEALQRSTCLVVHLAAVTEFGRPAQDYESTNIHGTRNIVEFASRSSSGPIPLVHVSTAYVCGKRGGIVTEDDLQVGQEFTNDYERSKYEAEVLVREAMAQNLPAIIVRPSIVVGHQRSGVIREFGNIYVVLRVLTEGRVRAIPGVYGALLDLVPLDYVSSVIKQTVIEFEKLQGKTLHAVSGQALTLRTVSDVLAEYPSLYVPRFIPPENFRVEAMNRKERWYYDRIVQLYDPYFQRRTMFSNDATLALLPRQKLVHPAVMLRNILNYAVKVNYLGRAFENVPAEEVQSRDP